MKRCSLYAVLRKGCNQAVMLLRKSFILIILIVFTATITCASDNADEDGLFSGFDDAAPLKEEKYLPPDRPFSNRLSGYTKLGTTYNFAHHVPKEGETDWRGLSRLWAELQLEATIPLKTFKLFAVGKGFYDAAYSINGRSDYTTEVLDDYEKEIELREAYLQGTLIQSLDIKAGRQIVVWGRSDNIRVTDILNPLDNREPGLTDIEDLRLPMVMTKLDYYYRDWNLGLVAIHERRFDKNPSFGHDFYPGATESPHEEIPAHTMENTEYAAELKGMFSGWDISIYGARVYNNQGTFVPETPVSIEHRRIYMTGTAMSIAKGNILYILEAAHFRRLRFMTDYGNDYNRTDLLAGIEYSGFTDTIISFDIANRHIHGFSKILEDSPESPKRNEYQTALRISRDFMNDNLSLTVLLIYLGKRAQNGAIQRLAAEYDITDGWSITGGAVFYESGIGAMKNAGDNDRLFMEIRHDF